jgi:hypothetical protein
MSAILRASAVLLCFAAHFAPPFDQELRFVPESGTKVTREWSRESTRTLTQITVSTGEETRSTEAPSVVVVSKARLVISDSFPEVKSERPVRIVRTYDTIEKSAEETATTPDGERETTLKEVSDLAGRSVVFAWDEESGAYKCSFEEGEDGAESSTSDTPLETLVADMDLVGFLPTKPVSVGDHWPVSFEAVRYGFLRPGGRLEFRDEEGRRHGGKERALSDAAWKGLEGECTATLKDLRDEDDARIAVIALEGEFSTSAELESDDGSQTAGMKHSEKFEGELLWDIRAKRARSMQIESKTDFKLLESREGKQPDGTSVRLNRTLDFVEESTCTYEIRPQ